jgi:hypothetical protein
MKFLRLAKEPQVNIKQLTITLNPFWRIVVFVLLLCLYGCNRAEKKFVGTWEFDHYTVLDTGIGSMKEFVPDEVASPIEDWMEKTKGMANSVLIFHPDLTYEESFSGSLDGFSMATGTFSVSSDLSELEMNSNGRSIKLPIMEISDEYFVYKKTFEKYKVPLEMEITYKKVKD